jgi:hypothetical protein
MPLIKSIIPESRNGVTLIQVLSAISDCNYGGPYRLFQNCSQNLVSYHSALPAKYWSFLWANFCILD